MTEPDQNKKALEYLISRLKEEGTVTDPYQVRLHENQGYMSSVSILSSGFGEFILHISQPTPEHIHQKTWEKLKAITDLFRDNPAVPVAKMHIAERFENVFITAQTRLSGVPAGKRIINNATVADEWFADTQSLSQQILSALAKIHDNKFLGYGVPIVINGKLQGKYKSWREFFQEEIPIWIKSVRKADARLGYENLSEKLETFRENVLKEIPETEPALIHGDIINPSNILVKDGKITGILDWEWSLMGDPAWEFAMYGWEPVIRSTGLEPYFRARGITAVEKKKEFLDRTKLYWPLWCLWGAHLHAEDEDSFVYDTLRKWLYNCLHI